ncbi:hypothetical protein CKY28_17370 [Sphingomonas lenta]|uniref:DUF2939 domain-containing protein n=1 Tax=Sphingomonas lenta TaxID=1141887 RepID=A0A2A2SAX8_9SPHN|nr:hypothetical protein CKY28_17370 [Sphingomonas lenta]
MRRKIWAALMAIVVLFAVAYVASPFWAARQFREAALSADVDRLKAAVDFPAVRESLKSQLSVAMTAKFENDPAMRKNPFAGFGMTLMPTVVGKLVDGLTPTRPGTPSRIGSHRRCLPQAHAGEQLLRCRCLRPRPPPERRSRTAVRRLLPLRHGQQRASLSPRRPVAL